MKREPGGRVTKQRARAGPAPETTPIDIYALLMHRKHFTPIAATIDLIVYREVTCTRRARFAALHRVEYPVYIRCPRGRTLCVSAFSRTHVPSLHAAIRMPLAAATLWRRSKMFLLIVRIIRVE